MKTIENVREFFVQHVLPTLGETTQRMSEEHIAECTLLAHAVARDENIASENPMRDACWAHNTPLPAYTVAVALRALETATLTHVREHFAIWAPAKMPETEEAAKTLLREGVVYALRQWAEAGKTTPEVVRRRRLLGIPVPEWMHAA